MTEYTPQFKHDCDKCQFIAPMVLFGRNCDIYKSCSQFGGYIIRYSDEGSDYHTTYERKDLPINERYRCVEFPTNKLLISMDEALCNEITRICKQAML